MNQTTDGPTYTIRFATDKDIEALTELHCASFSADEHVPVMLGRDYVRAAYRWIVKSDMAYGLVADTGEKIVGLVAVCNTGFTMPMFFACLPEFFAALIHSPGLLFKKRLWSRLFRRPDTTRAGRVLTDYPGFAQMTIGAVDVNFRGAGVFRALVEATKQYSQKRGSRAIRAGIYKMNQPSRRVFIRGGWIETPQLETNDTVFYVHFIDASFAAEIGLSDINPHMESLSIAENTGKV